MRIDRLDLLAFGSFTDRSLDLSAGSEGLHVIYGNNEAGKSTSLRALIYLLFGFPNVTTDNYIHANSQLRIGGTLRNPRGEKIAFIRRKGSKGTLLAPDGTTVLKDSALSSFLQHDIDENLFQKLYGIDHEKLVSGGNELLAQSGDLGQALFSAAAGTAGLRGVLSDLQTKADELFKPRASKKVVNQAILNFKEAHKQIKSLSLPVSEWNKLQKELKNTLTALSRLESTITEVTKSKNKLSRLNRVKGALAERRMILDQLSDMKDVPYLPKDFELSYKTTIQLLQKSIDSKAKTQIKLENLSKEADSLHIAGELLDNEDQIITIFKELGAVETAIEDRPQQDGKRRHLRNEAQQLLKKVRPDLGLDHCEQLRPFTINKKWISDLAHEFGLITQKKEKTKSSLLNFETEESALAVEIETLAHTDIDLAELRAAVTAVRKSGNIEQRLRESEKRVSAQKRLCVQEFGRLGRYSGTIDALAHIPMPETETLDSFEKKFDDLERSARDNSRQKKELEEEKHQAVQMLKTLLQSTDVPTIAELERARKQRNNDWLFIRKTYLEDTDADRNQSPLFQSTEITDIVVSYEQDVDAADQIADHLRLSADQVVKRAELEIRIETISSQLTLLEESQKAHHHETLELQQQWKNIWDAQKIDAGTPREMKQWLLRLSGLLSSWKTVETYTSESMILSETLETNRATISQQIKKFCPSLEIENKRLETLLTICEQRIEQEEELRARRSRLNQSLEITKKNQSQLSVELVSIENDLSHWKQNWEKAISGLGLAADTHPVQAVELFEQLLAFFTTLDKSEDLRKRIYGIDLVSENFKTKVFAFADRINYDIDGQEATAVAARLYRSLTEAREARASHKKIASHIKEITEELAETEITIQSAREQLAGLRKQAGVKNDDELERAGAQSSSLRELRGKLETIEQELSRNGDGLSITVLEKEAAESDLDSIEIELETATNQLKQLHNERDSLRDQRNTLENEVQSKDGSSAAADASERAEQHLAEVVSGVEQYLRLQIASLILNQQIESYRKKNQAPLLARTAELFSHLTLNSYSSLRDELDDKGGPILLGVRANDTEVPVSGMSDGTRDQLFLALRLATLEQHLNTEAPIPFIVDDILVGFDDNRTKAGLEVIARLAEKTQVLLFTHHSRVVELASQLEAESGIFIHELN